MTCFVPKCTTGREKGLESHTFRPDTSISQEWTRILGLHGKVFNPQNPRHRICHRHFHPHEIIKGDEVTINGESVLVPGKKWKLKTGVVPTLFPGLDSRGIEEIPPQEDAEPQFQATILRKPFGEKPKQYSKKLKSNTTDTIPVDQKIDPGGDSCLICCRKTTTLSGCISKPPVPGSKEELALNTLAELYNFSKSDSFQINCCEPCTNDLKKVNRILLLIKPLQEQLRNVKDELNKKFLESSQTGTNDNPLRRNIIENIIFMSSHVETLPNNSAEPQNNPSSSNPDLISDENEIFLHEMKPDITQIIPESTESIHISQPFVLPEAFLILPKLPINSSDFESHTINLEDPILETFIKKEELTLKSRRFHRQCQLNSSQMTATKEEEEEQGSPKCHFCPKYLMSKSSLETHLKKMHKGETKCKRCALHFPDPIQLNSHFKTHLTNSSKFHCSICTSRFDNRGALTYHIKQVHSKSRKRPKQSYPCSKCTMIFTSNLKLLLHTRRSHPRIHPCPNLKCTLLFRFKGDLVEHLKISHPDLMAYNCEICTKSFQTDTALNCHIKAVHFVKIKSKSRKSNVIKRAQNLCDICGKSFANLGLHKKKHERVEAPHTCDFCSKSFSTSSRLNAHRRNVHIKKFPCKFCSLSFGNRHRLRFHQIKHSNVKNYKCPQCPATFKWDRSFKDHYARRHSNLSFPCDVCKQVFDLKRRLVHHKCPGPLPPPNTLICPIETCKLHFNSDSSLRRHHFQLHKNHGISRAKKLRTIYQCTGCKKEPNGCTEEFQSKKALDLHLGIPPKVKDRVKEKEGISLCEYCPRSFKSKGGLRLHQNYMHKGRKPPIKSCICEICGGGFVSEHTLLIHRNQFHDKNYRFYCEVCGKGFYINANLTSHKKSHEEWPDKGKVNTICRYCKIPLPSQIARRIHEGEYHAERQRLKCTHCGREFKWHRGLRFHISLSHSSEWHFCDCGKKFKTRPYLLMHRRICKSIVKIPNV